MKLPSFFTDQPELKRFDAILRKVLSSLSVDNFVVQELAGTTSSTENSSALFRHKLESAPRMWLPLEGDVYIPRNGLGSQKVDVRSRLASEQFKLLLIR